MYLDESDGEYVEVSVPIRGLFNLTTKVVKSYIKKIQDVGFRPHQGII